MAELTFQTLSLGSTGPDAAVASGPEGKKVTVTHGADAAGERWGKNISEILSKFPPKLTV